MSPTVDSTAEPVKVSLRANAPDVTETKKLPGAKSESVAGSTVTPLVPIAH